MNKLMLLMLMLMMIGYGDRVRTHEDSLICILKEISYHVQQ